MIPEPIHPPGWNIERWRARWRREAIHPLSRRKSEEAGFTLVEVIVAIASLNGDIESASSRIRSGSGNQSEMMERTLSDDEELAVHSGTVKSARIKIGTNRGRPNKRAVRRTELSGVKAGRKGTAGYRTIGISLRDAMSSADPGERN